MARREFLHPQDPTGDSLRSQAETIGLILVLGMVIAGGTLIVVFGASAIGETQTGLSVDRAEKSLTQFDSKSALVALEHADVQEVSFPERADGRIEVLNNSGRMSIEINNQTSGTTTILLSQALGEVRYSNGETNLAYQGGGVWRKEDGEDGSTMISPPEFHFRNATLTLPVMALSGDAKISGNTRVVHNGTEKEFPNQTRGSTFLNPLMEHKVTVTVESEYYRGWGSYFEERTGGEVEYDHSSNTVTLHLKSPIGTRTMLGAATSLSASGTFSVSGQSKTNCERSGGGTRSNYVNSYNSSMHSTVGDCNSQQGVPGIDNHAGDVIYGGDVDLSGGSGRADFRGDIKTGGDFFAPSSGGGGQPRINGNISHAGTCNPSNTDCENRIHSPPVTAHRERISGVDTVSPINSHIDSTVDSIKNDPDGDDDIDDTASPPTLTMGGDQTLDAGQYYLKTIDLGGTLELDTTGGPITLAVEEDIDLDGGTIQVTGQNTTKVYVKEGDPAGATDLHVDRSSEITVPEQDAAQFRVYGKSDFNAFIGKPPSGGGGGGSLGEFQGIIYAPPGPSGTGGVHLDFGEIYGGVLTGTTTINKGSIHYDTELSNKQIISPGAKVVKVTFLHVSVNRLTVTD